MRQTKRSAALAAILASTWIMPIQLTAANVAKAEKLASRCRSGKAKACSELAKIASTEKDARVRSAAVLNLTDQHLLAMIALGDTDASVRRSAVANLSDQHALAKVAIHDKEGTVRSAAVAKLTDQSLLAKIALEDTEPGVRIAAVARVGDESLLAKIAAHDKEVRVRSAAVAAAEQVRKEIAEGGDILDLLNENKIEVHAQGRGIDSVSVSVRRLVPYPLSVRIPVGSFFVSSNSSTQNMVTTGQSKVELTTAEWVSAPLQAACANRPKHIPDSSDSFTVVRSAGQSELARLMPVLDKARLDNETRQAAIWIVTDNANYDDLGILIGAFGCIVTPFGHQFGCSRRINERETALAMKICVEAGVDITKKAIWRDRRRIISGLKDNDLRAWLSQQE